MNNKHPVQWTPSRLLDDAVHMIGTDKFGNEFSGLGYFSGPAFQWDEASIEVIEDIRCESGDELLVHSTWKDLAEFHHAMKDYYLHAAYLGSMPS